MHNLAGVTPATSVGMTPTDECGAGVNKTGFSRRCSTTFLKSPLLARISMDRFYNNRMWLYVTLGTMLFDAGVIAGTHYVIKEVLGVESDIAIVAADVATGVVGGLVGVLGSMYLLDGVDRAIGQPRRK